VREVSIECGFCERDLRGGHDADCPRWTPRCGECGGALVDSVCEDCGTRHGPILVPCEGSGCPPAGAGTRYEPFGMCSMCGAQDVEIIDGLVAPHERDDILARLERGDFG
jgi:hypothetical protein